MAFEDCYNLTGNLTIPGSVKSIGREAFENCYSLKSPTIEEGVCHIGERAFANCIRLNGDLILPNSLVSIGLEAFINCDNLTIKYNGTEKQ